MQKEEIRRERFMRQDKVDVDMSVVEKLIRNQREINNRLKNTSVRCTLHPKSDLEPCKSCENYKKCRNHKKERDYILSGKEAYSTSKRRRRKEEKATFKEKNLSFQDEEKGYPCEPFDFACPERGRCEKGKKCPWEG